MVVFDMSRWRKKDAGVLLGDEVRKAVGLQVQHKTAPSGVWVSNPILDTNQRNSCNWEVADERVVGMGRVGLDVWARLLRGE
jgi:hypothetical protein